MLILKKKVLLFILYTVPPVYFLPTIVHQLAVQKVISKLTGDKPVFAEHCAAICTTVMIISYIHCTVF